jgi:hypothetical protein
MHVCVHTHASEVFYYMYACMSVCLPVCTYFVLFIKLSVCIKPCMYVSRLMYQIFGIYCDLQNNPDSFQRFQRSFVPDYYWETLETSPNYFASRSMKPCMYVSCPMYQIVCIYENIRLLWLDTYIHIYIHTCIQSKF